MLPGFRGAMTTASNIPAPAPTPATRFEVWWSRLDGSAELHMGDFESESTAEAAIPEIMAEFADQCPEEYGPDDGEDGDAGEIWRIYAVTTDQDGEERSEMVWRSRTDLPR